MSFSRPVAHAVLRSSPLAPFQVRSFRFQWPADLITSWGGEMENVILGWYILVSTGSVLLLTLFASLQYFGTLLAPMIGLAGDRLGHRNVLCAMRAVYATLAATIATLAFSGWLNPTAVMVLAAGAGLVRPSDLAMRGALVAETIPTERLVGAMGASRITGDAARIAGPLAGSALFAAFGMGPAYLCITLVYITGFALTLGTGAPRRFVEMASDFAFLRDMREGLAYVWADAASLAALLLAFLVNLTAYPLTSGLLPYVAEKVYHVDQTGLGYLVASFATGSLLGSSLSAWRGGYQAGTHDAGLRAGVVRHAAGVRPHAGRRAWPRVAAAGRPGAEPEPGADVGAVALRRGAAFRGRVMGLRMMAIYGLPLGLMLAGALIDALGFAPAITLLATVGALLTLAIGLHWRAALWPREAPANAR